MAQPNARDYSSYFAKIESPFASWIVAWHKAIVARTGVYRPSPVAIGLISAWPEFENQLGLLSYHRHHTKLLLHKPEISLEHTAEILQDAIMIKNLMVMVCVFGLFACATAQPEPQIKQQDIVFEQPKPAPVRDVNVSAVFSNDNVLVFPVTGPINDNMESLNRYRGVLDNTTAGGYTVFDPSVTVFAVNNTEGLKPAYLPNYSVPQHAAQYKSMDDVFPPAQSMGIIPMAPQSILAEPLAPKPSAPVMKPSGTRSPPMLTGY